jgi:hypothetical protein
MAQPQPEAGDMDEPASESAPTRLCSPGQQHEPIASQSDWLTAATADALGMQAKAAIGLTPVNTSESTNPRANQIRCRSAIIVLLVYPQGVSF